MLPRHAMALILVSAWGLSGCGGPAALDETLGSLRIVLQESAEDVDMLRNLAEPDFSVFTTPSALSDFNCFGVNVTGAGVPPNSSIIGCTSTSNFGGAGFGAMSNLGPRGTPLRVQVPGGTGRRVDVIGLYPAPSECGGTSSADQNLYLLGRTTVDVTEDATVTVPLAMSTTSIGVCTGGGSTTTVSPSQARKDDAGSCTSISPGGGAVTTTTAVSISNANASDNAGDSASCLSSGGGQFLVVDYTFGANGLQPGQILTLTWRGRAGTTTSTYNFSNALTATGGTARINTGGSTWVTFSSITTTDTSASTYQTFTGSVTLTSAMIQGGCPSCSLFIRIAGGNPSSGQYSVVDTDFIQVSVQ